ncbi:sterol desaturase family protein [Ketobacter sp. MCCC 1A13808]|nr:sterol desaturase family protein [Ketobacter sp. MCCC 1A13808]
MNGLTLMNLTFFQWWLSCYTILISLYFSLSWFISNDIKTTRLAKIQKDKELKLELVKRDIKQSVKSLLLISFFVGSAIWLNQEGFTVVSAWEPSILSFVLWLLVSMFLYDTWFYWVHRIIHTKRFYRRIHLWHHRSKSPVVWSNNSDTLLDGVLTQSYWVFAALVLPMPTALVILVHKIYDQVTGMLGHAGYEYGGMLTLPPSPFAAVTFHDQHHEHFTCNYATQFLFWDKLMGTLHPDYNDVTARNLKSPQQSTQDKIENT